MQILINTDPRLDGHEILAARVSQVLERALSRVAEFIARVDVVQLSDENEHKSGQADQHCSINACLEGGRPISVTHLAINLDQAVDGALSKLIQLIAATRGWLSDHQSQSSNAALPRPKRTACTCGKCDCASVVSASQ